MIGRLHLFLTSLIMVMSFCSLTHSQESGQIPVTPILSEPNYAPGAEGQIEILFKVPPAHHITSRDLGLFFVEITPVKGFQFKEPVFPPTQNFEGEEVYKDEVVVMVDFLINKDLALGKYRVKIDYGYQVCIEIGAKMCYLPQQGDTTIIISVISPTSIEKNSLSSKDEIYPPPTKTKVQKQSMEVRFSSALSQGSILALLLVFIAGVLSSFTPCVYPVIPITIGYIGGRAQGKRLRGLLLSIFLVLGIATIYSVLGLLAAATGSIFGSYTQHPLVLIIIALIFAAMGASLLGAFDITLPASLQSKMHTERKGFLGAYLVGIITGVIAVPCVGPVLVALLAWVAQSGSLLIGFLLLFVYALGMGMLFVFIGTFTGVLTSLPGAGQWMETIKHIFGVVLIAGAVFILKPLLSMGVYYLAWSILLIVTGIFSGASEIMSPEANTGKKWSRALGLILLLAGIVLFIKGFNLAFKLEESTGGRIALVEKKQAILWLVNEPEKAFAEARASGKKLIMDFYADWCAACVELDEKTWTDPELVRLSSNFVFLKLDLTKITPELKAEQIKYQIRGMPTVIFFDPNGKELTRFSGFKSAREVLDLINLL